MRALIARGLTYSTVQLQFQQGDVEQTLPTSIAAFLLARGQHATLMWAVEGIYESATMYSWDKALLERDFGRALGETVEMPSGVFKREYEGGTVALDCNIFAAAFSPA